MDMHGDIPISIFTDTMLQGVGKAWEGMIGNETLY